MTDKYGYDLSLSVRVEELIREGTISQVLALVKKEIESEWVVTGPQDAAIREQLYSELHALNRVDLRISAIIQSLRMSEANRNG